ncbi:MAG TPA: DUF3553 domain-containing protein [Gemmataceae bacterium]|jgi:hypothetical protein
MTNAVWEPKRFQVGDVVVDVDRPKWGKGIVVEDRTFARSPTKGQRLDIVFEGRGRVMVFTAQRILRRVSAPSGDATAAAGE